MGWTPERKRQLSTLYAEGLSHAEIGTRLGTSPAAVECECRRQKLSRPSKQAVEQKPSRRCACGAKAIGSSSVCPTCSKALTARFVEQYRAGAGVLEIAQQAGLTYYAVKHRIMNAGAYKRASVAPAAAPQPVEPLSPRQGGSALLFTLPGVTEPLSPHRALPAPRCCAWPFGHPDDKAFRFCGCPSEPGRPYCAEHVAVAYVRTPTNREGFVPAIAVKRMADRGTLTAVGQLWTGDADAA